MISGLLTAAGILGMGIVVAGISAEPSSPAAIVFPKAGAVLCATAAIGGLIHHFAG